jgi:hypothetical protein
MNPQDPELSVIFARLDALERQNRRFKRIGTTIVLLAVSATLLMGQARTTKVLEANEFVLRDPSGKIRGRLGIGITGRRLPSTGPSDLASLELYDPAGTPVAMLMAATNEGSFGIGPASPGMTAGIAMDAGSKSAMLSIDAVAASTHRRMLLSADPSETSIVLGSIGEKQTISLTKGNSSYLVFTDMNGNPIWTAP